MVYDISFRRGFMIFLLERIYDISFGEDL